MTRDEAIQVLQTALTSPFIYGEYADAIDMAIEALTQGSRKVTQESTQDLISRADAIEAIEEITWYHQNRNGEMVSGANSTEGQAWYKSQDIYTALEALPSAEARPTGEWTITFTDDGFGGENTHLICSVCGSEPLAWSSRKFFRYCPSCGAKMGGGDSK